VIHTGLSQVVEKIDEYKRRDFLLKCTMTLVL
jgi:hypothetical protein